MGDANDRYNPNKPVRFKTSMLRSDLYDFSDAYIVVKGAITVAGGSNSSRKTRPLAFKNNAPFMTAFQICTICLNIAKIIKKQHAVYGIITKMN